jgi:hypothetical protein
VVSKPRLRSAPREVSEVPPAIAKGLQPESVAEAENSEGERWVGGFVAEAAKAAGIGSTWSLKVTLPPPSVLEALKKQVLSGSRKSRKTSCSG